MNVDAAQVLQDTRQPTEARNADKWGLDLAYTMPNGVFTQGSTMYIAGTKSARDVADDLLIPLGLTAHGQRYADAEAHLKPSITRVVGHSLGGSVALELASKHGLESEVYGTPVLSLAPSAKRHRHNWDPISMFDRGASSTSSPSWNPHGY